MSLKNINTGQPVSDIKNLTAQQTLIGQQELKIYSLTSQNTQLLEENISLKKKLSEKENQTNTIESLKEKLNVAETQLGNVKNELETERKKPPRYEYRYEAKCYNCHKSEYDKKIEETRENNSAAVEDRKKAAGELAEAKKLRAYHENVVNERVDMIVKKKTIPERLGAWFDLHRKVNDMVFYIFPLLYAVAVSIMAICRNEIFRKDFVEALSSVGHAFAAAFGGVKWLICLIAGLTENIGNKTVTKILWWVIVIILTALVVVIILAIILFGGLKLLSFFNDHFDVFICKGFFSMLLADFGAIVFLGDYIRNIIPINLMITYHIVIVMYFIVRYGLPAFIPWFLDRIVEVGRSLNDR